MQEGTSHHRTKLETYHRVAELFNDKYPTLVDNFAGFLDQHEARHVGKVSDLTSNFSMAPPNLNKVTGE